MAKSQVQRFVPLPQRGYPLGARNPVTLPDDSHYSETYEQNRVGTRFWRKARAWAMKPGGKYV